MRKKESDRDRKWRRPNVSTYKSAFVIQHVEPYKYTRILRIILISLFHVSSARFAPVAITL